MTFSRIKNLTSKNLPKISEAFTIVINLTHSNAWLEGVSLRPCRTPVLNEKLDCKKDNREEALSHDKHAVGVLKKRWYTGWPHSNRILSPD